jgi:hypothetical protein
MPKGADRGILLFFFILFLSIPALTQIRVASPYSRFGIGDLNELNNAWNFSLGEISFGLRNPSHINYGNPASYTAFDSISFVFEGGVVASSVQLKSTLEKENRNYASVGYLLFGFPVFKWWRTCIGMTPYSDVGYNVANIQEMEGIGTVWRIYSGEGGVNRFFWGNAFRIIKNLSIGVNASYMFGTMNRQAVALFPDSNYFANIKIDNYISINDIYLNYGIQYHARLKNDLHFTVGVVFAPETKLSAKTDLLARTFFLGSAGIEYYRDTLATASGYKGKIVIPTYIGGGFSFEKTDKWLVGADFKWQNWEKFTAFGLSDSLVNSYQVGVAGEIVPNINSYANYLKRVRYRLGFYYSSTYLHLRRQTLAEYAVTLGFGLPLKGSKTALNLGAQVGSRGTTEAGLIRETFFKFTIGFTINERWFVKRKYN